MIYSVFNSNLLLIWGRNFAINKASLILRLPTLLLWSTRGWNDNMNRKWVIKNILKENSTYINNSWEKPFLSLTQSWTLHPFLVTVHPRLCRRELRRYVSYEGKSICRGDTPTITYYFFYSNGKIISLFLHLIKCLWNEDARVLRYYLILMWRGLIVLPI